MTNEVSDLSSLQAKLADFDADKKYVVNGIPRWLRLRICSVFTVWADFDVMNGQPGSPNLAKKKCSLKQSEASAVLEVASAKDLVNRGVFDEQYSRVYN